MTVLSRIVLYCIVQDCTVLLCIVLFYVVHECTALSCIILTCSIFFPVVNYNCNISVQLPRSSTLIPGHQYRKTSLYLNQPSTKITIYISSLYVCKANTIHLLSFVETPRKSTIAELSIRALGSSSVLLALMKIRPLINLRGVSTKLNKYNNVYTKQACTE